jgi:hypothetical protein
VLNNHTSEPQRCYAALATAPDSAYSRDTSMPPGVAAQGLDGMSTSYRVRHMRFSRLFGVGTRVRARGPPPYERGEQPPASAAVAHVKS